MALVDHLRELRNRLFFAAVAIIVGTTVAWFFYDQIYALLIHPLKVTQRQLEGKGLHPRPVLNGFSTAFILQLKVSLVAGLIGTSPVWLYQVWAFIMPGLHRTERKWTLIFVSIAGPLFLAGVALGYYVMPKGLTALLGFTPKDVGNLIPVDQYLNFILRVLLVFGLSFEIPLFVVLLNLAGIVKGRQLARYRSWIVFSTFVFAAVATPSTDPFTMILLALPMVILFLLSEVIARTVDRRRGRNSDEPDYSQLDDDTPSTIDRT